MSIKVLFMGAVLTLFVSNVFAQSAAVKSACNSAIKEMDRCVVVKGSTEEEEMQQAKDIIKEAMSIEWMNEETIKFCNQLKDELVKSNCGKNKEY